MYEKFLSESILLRLLVIYCLIHFTFAGNSTYVFVSIYSVSTR